MRSKIAVALLLGTLAFTPGIAMAEEDHSLEQLVIESANSPADHAALAKHFRAKAAQAREEASRHDRMARSYNVGKFTDKMHMEKHCKRISANATSSAAEYEELAKLHEAASKQP